MELFEEFKLICIELNKIGIIPTLMGSLGLEYVSKMKWNPSDIDIHVPGDPRGWEAPDELRIYNWDKIMFIMNNLNYELIDIHEHELKKIVFMLNLEVLIHYLNLQRYLKKI